MARAMATRCISPPLRRAGKASEEEGLDAVAALGGGLVEELEGELDVFGGGEGREEVEELEDGADAASAQGGEWFGAEPVECFAAEPDGAGVGRGDAAEAVEQGGLAAAGGAEEGDALAGGDGEIDVGEEGAWTEGFAEVLAAEHGLGDVNNVWIGRLCGGAIKLLAESGLNGQKLVHVE